MRAFGRLIVPILLALYLLTLPVAPALAAEGELIPVRVGAVKQEGYSQMDEDGVVRGVDAEYLAKIAQYAGFELRYTIYGSFSELLNSLEKGEIDLSMGLSKTPEREERFLFSNQHLAESYDTIKVRSNDDVHEYGNLLQLDEMRIGYTSGSSVGSDVRRWAEENGISPAFIAFPSEAILEAALELGEVDAIATTAALMPELRVILSFASNKYYVIFNADRLDLKLAVDTAMNRILMEDIQYSAHLYYNQVQRKQSAVFVLSKAQKDYLASRADSPVRVAVVAQDPPFNVSEHGEARGIIRDYYDQIAELLRLTEPGFSFVYATYPDFDAAADALAAGEADVMGMVRMSAVEASRRSLILTGAFEDLPIVTLQLYSHIIPDGALPTAAVLESDLEAITLYLRRDSGNYNFLPVSTLTDAYDAIYAGRADLAFTSLPQATWLLNQHRSGIIDMTALPETGWNLTGAVNLSNSELGSILSQAAGSRATDFLGISAANTSPKLDLLTILHRLPPVYVYAGVLLLVFLTAAIFILTIRALRLRASQRANAALIESQQELLRAYETDPLTGLYNRNTALRKINESLTPTDPFTLVLVSFDNVRAINESFGYQQGDLVIQKLAENLKGYATADGQKRFVARYSGDEFLFLFKGVRMTEDSKRLADLLDVASRPVMLEATEEGGDTIWPHISMGVSVSDGVSAPEQVVRSAAIAASAASQDGHAPICFFSGQLKEELARSMAVRDELIRCINEDGLTMVYQPKISLVTGQMVGTEALMRLKSGKYSPGVFIPVAESAGLIQRIGRISTRLVIEQIAAWQREGFTPLPVSLNYSSHQLGDPDYPEYLLGLLRKHGVDPSLVNIEVTESLFLEQGEASAALFRKLRSNGIKLHLDDFGSGYSSLQYLSYVPVDVLKIDKSLIDTYLHREGEKEESAGSAFISDVIRLAHDLGKETVVEGVEKDWQVALLRQLGCEIIQGYFFSRPLPPEDIPAFALSDAQKKPLAL